MADGIGVARQIATTFPSAHIWVGNLSIGGTEADPATDDEIDAATGQMAIAVATGNGCTSSADYPAAYHQANEMAVAASDPNDQRSVWGGGQCSNGGGDIAAPGTNILTTGRDGGFYYVDGTSVAAPQVSGAAALLLSVCPLQPIAAIATIEGTADEVAALDGVATDGRRLDAGAALASCASSGHTQGTATVSASYSQIAYHPDFGSIDIDIDGYVTAADYNTSQPESDLNQAIVQAINENPYVTATSGGSTKALVATRAAGPYTGYSISVSVRDGCPRNVPHLFCGPAPYSSTSGFAAGH